MNAFFKLIAFAVLGTGAALFSPASSALAQIDRQAQAGPAMDPMPRPPVCCTPALKPVNTNASWTVTLPPAAPYNPTENPNRVARTVLPPASSTQQAVPLTSWPYYAAPAAGSQWIGPNANAGSTSQPSGNYVYSYHFCLCAAPPRVSPFPAAMWLKVLSDNNFIAKLNTIPIGDNSSMNPNTTFYTPTTIASVPPNVFHAGDNVLDITVNNISGPTGLDVTGWISGYFQQLPPGVKCPHYPSIPPHELPN